jgi:uncharacterized protein YkwD
MPKRLPCVLLVVLSCVALPLAAADSKDPKKVELSEVEQAILDATNKEREKEKLPPLKPNKILCEVARAHSANMAKQGKMEHELDGKNPADRVRAAGYIHAHMAENIAVSDGEKPEGIVKAWMDSKEHKENILNEKYTEIGIGLAKNDKGETYYTQEFGTPKKKR